MLKAVAVATLMVVALTACSTIQENPKTTIGAVGGGTLGGLIAAAAGANPAAIAASVIGGILVGGLVGNLLDQRDKRLAAEAQQKALETAPSGSTVSWQNPDNGHKGTVTPTHTFQTSSGQYCREFQTDVTVEGRSEKAYGTACRQPDGSWKIVS
jgi:surface antigen